MITKIMTKLIGKEKRQENKNLILFGAGKLISLFGSAIYTFAVGLYLLKVTGSGLTFATNVVLYTLPMVLINPLAGVVADRINKKLVVVGSDLLNGFFLLGIYLLAGQIGLSIPLVYSSTFVMTVLAAFFNIAIESAKPRLVRKQKLVTINSLARVIESGSQVLGPLVGGFIYAFIDLKLFILINALSFLLAAGLEFLINYQYSKTKPDNKLDKQNQNSEEQLQNKLWCKLKVGYQYIFSRQYLRALLYIFTALNFFFNFSLIVPVPYLLTTTWQVNSTIYGIVQGGLPVGMMIGALVVNRVIDRIEYSKLLNRIGYAVGTLVLAFALPLIILTGKPNEIFILIYYTILMLIGGIIVAWVDVPTNVLLQQIVPEELLGRVISAKLSMVKIIVPFALLISGYLVNLLSPLFLFLLGTLIFTLFNLWFFTSAAGKKIIDINNKNMD